jgi:HAD superfamily hydrolase (TIGR01509 family)
MRIVGPLSQGLTVKMSGSSVRNIIFDLGGILLNIDLRLTKEALKKLGWNDVDNEEEINKNIDLFHDFEKGLITPGTFRSHLRQLTGQNNRDSEIDESWTAMILDIPADRVKYLENLRKDYHIFLLSNTNEIHKKKFHGEFEQNYGYSFYDLFERNHYSHEMGKRKPDPAIFLQVLEENQLVAAESLFIDDVEENVLSAESFGIKGLYIQPGTLLEILPVYLNNVPY